LSDADVRDRIGVKWIVCLHSAWGDEGIILSQRVFREPAEDLQSWGVGRIKQ
jgi:hypothetical protein